MNTSRSDLWLLLQLMDGSIPSAEREALRARLAEDKVLRARWQQLNSLKAPLDRSLLANSNLKPDDIAAFLDGTLSAEEEAAFELRCWDSKATLIELVSLSGSQGEEAVSQNLSSRLLGLMPGSEPLDDQAAGALIDLNLAPQGPRTAPVRTKVPRTMLVAGSIVVVLLASTLWFVLRDSEPEQIAEDKNQPAAIDDAPAPKLVDTPAPQNEEPPQDEPAPGVVPDSTPEANAPGSMIVETPVDPKDVAPKPKDATPKPAPSVPKSTVPKVASAAWETRGVVAVRSSVREPWHGLDAISRPTDAEFLTLVTSRAVTKSSTGAEFVISPESEVAGLTWGEVAEVQIRRGSAAFRMLKKGDTVRFLLGDKIWEATAAVDETSVAVSLLGLEPRLIVWAGKANVGAVRVARRNGLLFSKPRDVKKMTGDEADGYAWVDAWSQSQFNDTSLARLMKSTDLRADILSMGSGRKVTMMVAPELAVFKLLNSQVPAERQAALWWLMNNPDRGPQSAGRLAWANIEQSVGNAAVTGYMKAWLNQLRTGQPVQRAEVQQMVRALSLNPRAVQFVAIACLQHYTGVTRGFDPNAGNAERRAAINRWGTWLRSQ